MCDKEGTASRTLYTFLSTFILLAIQIFSSNALADADIRPNTVHENDTVTFSFEFHNHFAATIDVIKISSHFCWQDSSEKYYFKEDDGNLVRISSGENKTFYLTLHIPNFLNESETSRVCQIDTRIDGYWQELLGCWDHTGSILVKQEIEHIDQTNWTLWLILGLVVFAIGIIVLCTFIIVKRGRKSVR